MLRRDFIRSAAVGVGAAGLGAVSLPGTALALTGAEAESFVRATVEEVLELARAPGDPMSKAPALREIMERRAAVAQLARFAAGPEWRSMSDAQQARYSSAFSGYFARIYARRFDDIQDPQVTIEGTMDAGRKGMLVKSRFVPTNGDPVSFEWLITDRTGQALIADIVVEGVSTAVTQRNEIAALIASSPSIDAFIDRLETV